MTLGEKLRYLREVEGTIRGLDREGRPTEVAIASESTPVSNPAFDVTPAALVTGIITEKGVVTATEAGLSSLMPTRPV